MTFRDLLAFPNFLRSLVFFFSCVGTKAPPAAKMPWGIRSLVLRRSATREAIGIYHMYYQ